MQMQSIISILLATWFGLGAALGPRFQCLCADGTQTLEIGSQFCCDDDSRMGQEACNESGESERCSHDDCKSTPIQDTGLVLSDISDEEQVDSLSLTDQLPYTAFFALPNSPAPDSRIRLQLRCPPTTDLSQIRSVVLRV